MGVALLLLVLSAASVHTPGASTLGAPTNSPQAPVVGASGVWKPGSGGGGGGSPGTLDLSQPTAVTGLISVF